MWLTPAERRGAAFLVVLLLLGTAWDLWRVRAPKARAIARSSPSVEFHPKAPEAPASRAEPAGERIDLNRASAAAFDALPGIGPVLASRIVARRARVGPYRRLEELLDVPGIGPRLFERLRPLVVLGPAGTHADSMHSAKPDANGRAVSPSGSVSPDR